MLSGHNLAKKDIFGASDPYVRIDLIRGDGEGEEVLDAVLTKTKRRVGDDMKLEHPTLCLIKLCEMVQQMCFALMN